MAKLCQENYLVVLRKTDVCRKQDTQLKKDPLERLKMENVCIINGNQRVNRENGNQEDGDQDVH